MSEEATKLNTSTTYRLRSARTKIREIQDEDRKKWNGINAKFAGRPRQNAYDIPDEEIDANHRSCVLLNLIQKIDDLQSTNWISLKYKASASTNRYEQELEVAKDFIRFTRITEYTYKTYTSSKSSNFTKEEAESAVLKYKMLNWDSKLVRKMLECKD